MTERVTLPESNFHSEHNFVAHGINDTEIANRTPGDRRFSQKILSVLSSVVITITEIRKRPLDNMQMKFVTHRSAGRLIAVVILLSCGAFATSVKVEGIGPLPTSAASEGLRQAVADKGYRVTLEDGWTAEFWFVRQLTTEKKDVPGALYPELSNGEFVGVVRFPQGMSDFRGQSIPAAFYTLRYQLLPQDGNHMGVAPNPDFLLASPVSDDARPEQAYVYRKLIALSAKSTGTGHPAVIALDSAGKAGTVTKEDNGSVLFSVDVPAPAGAGEKLGIVVKGAAAQ